MTALSQPTRPLPLPHILAGLGLTLGGVHLISIAVQFPHYAIASASDLILLMAEILVTTVATAFATSETRKRARLEGGAWQCLTLATATLLLGTIATVVMLGAGISLTPPTFVDGLLILSRMLLVAALALFMSRTSTRGFWLRTALELGVIAVGMILLYTELVIEPLVEASASLPTGALFGAIYPAFDLLIIWLAFVLLSRYNKPPLPLALLITASILFGCADALFNLPFIKVTLQASVTSALSSLLFSASTLTLTLAAAAQIRQPFLLRLDAARASIGVENTSVFARAWPYLQMIVPHLWIGVAYFMLLGEGSEAPSKFDLVQGSIVRIGAGMIVAMVTLRQLLILRDKEKIAAQLQRVLQSSEMLAAPAQGDAGQMVLHQLRKLLLFDQAAMILFQDDKAPAGLRLTGDETHTETFAARDHAIWLDRLARQRLRINIAHASDDQARSDEDRLQNVLFPARGRRVRSWAAVSLMAQDRPVGLLAVADQATERYGPDHIELLVAFARQAVATLESARLLHQERNSAVIAERSRLARDLHDSVSQAVFGALLGIKTARETQENDRAKSRMALDYAESLADAALVEMRALIYELRPETLQEEGLVGALERQVAALCKRHNIEAQLNASAGEPALPFEAKEALYRIALEAVQNTVRHGRARKVIVTISRDRSGHTLQVQDDGRGFDPSQRVEGHFGMSTMRERAQQLGASLQVESIRETAPQGGADDATRAHGTTITVHVPA